MGLAFQQFLQDRGVERIEEMIRFAMPFFTDRYGEHSRRMGMDRLLSHRGAEDESNDPLPLTGIYLILAGYSLKDRHQPYHLHLLGSEEDGSLINTYPPSSIIVVPRSLSMERRLEAQCKEGPSLQQVLSLCKSFLKKRSADEEVGPPFYFATITRSGFKEIDEREVEG